MIAGALKANVMPTTARVARIHEYGPPEVLRFEDIVVGEPGDDEALIRNTVIGLNFVDVYYRRGSLPVPAFPAIIGDEAAGVVEAVGKNVKNVSVGDRVVYGDIAFGAYATARLHPADRLVRTGSASRWPAVPTGLPVRPVDAYRVIRNETFDVW